MAHGIDSIKQMYNDVNNYVIGAVTGDKSVKKIKFPPLFDASGVVQNLSANYNDGTIWSGYGSMGSHSTASTNMP